MERYIAAIEEVPLFPADGSARAVKVTLKNGRIDYILYAGDNDRIYTVDGSFRFSGFVGVVSFENGKITRKYLHDGSLLADQETQSAVTGTILDFTGEPALQNEILLSCHGTIPDPGMLAGKCIFIANHGVRSTAYQIKRAAVEGENRLRLDIGDITLIRCYQDRFAPEKGYVYDINPGDAFRIPL